MSTQVNKPFNFECDRDQLVGALNLMTYAVERRSAIPILEHVLLRVEGTKLTITGTDMDVWVKHTINLHSNQKTANTFTLPWYGLAKAVSQLTPRLLFEILPKEGRVNIEGDDGTMLSFATLDTTDFPERKWNPGQQTYMVKGTDLARIIGTVSHAASDEATRYYLCGALFECPQDNVLRMVATDGHRMVIDEIEAPSLKKEASPIIVPSNTLRIVARHCKVLGNAVITSGLDGISFDFGYDVVVQSKCIDGTFPAYQNVIPTKNDKLVTIDADALHEVLARCPKTNPKAKRAVKLAFKNNTVRLSMEAIDGLPGLAASVSCQYEDDPIEIGFNPIYLREALGILDGMVGIALDKAGSPALLMSGAYPQVILMPMRF